MRTLTVDDFVSRMATDMVFAWVNRSQGTTRQIYLTEDHPTNPCHIVGYLSLIHAPQIQIIGLHEMQYLQQLSADIYDNALRQLFKSEKLACIIITDHCEILPNLQQQAIDHQVPLLSSPLPAQQVMASLHGMLRHLSAEYVTLHGVFMDVLGMGVLIMGDSGTGKSELALELVSRGHRLVADDAPEFQKMGIDVIEGTCPLNLTSFLEVRGLGILNVQKLFGDSAIKRHKFLKLIVKLKTISDAQMLELDRLYGEYSSRTILGVEMPEIMLPVAPGRNLAVLLECAVRNHSLKLQGYVAADELAELQQRALLNDHH